MQTRAPALNKYSSHQCCPALDQMVENWAHTRRLGFCFGGVSSSSQRSSSFLRRDTMWALQLPSPGPRSMASSKAAPAVPMGPRSPRLTTDPRSRPIAPVSSSEVSRGEGGGRFLQDPEAAGPRQARRRLDRLCLLPPSAPSAFPAVQYLSQPQPQPYTVHGHFQPTQTGEDAPARAPGLSVLPASAFHTPILPFVGFLQPGGALSLQKQMEHANQQTSFSDSVSTEPGQGRGSAGPRGAPGRLGP